MITDNQPSNPHEHASMFHAAASHAAALSEQLIRDISAQKHEPEWMLAFRLRAREIFMRKELPTWGADLSELDMRDICYYLRSVEKKHSSWADVPQEIHNTFNKLGVPQAEKEWLAGVGAQYESELVYKQLKEEWRAQGVIFTDISEALMLCPDIVKKYFATVIPAHDNMFAALNSATWSGGSFIYVPEGVHVTMPLQAYFRMNEPRMGQFERTLIIAEKNSYVHYVEGCSAPVHRDSSLHSAVVEIIAHEGAHVRYTTIQNWSHNVYNLVTKRAVAYRRARVEWVDGNFGSKVTMKYPCIILKEPQAQGEIISIAVAKDGQHHDSGGKIIHLAPDTRSHIIAKSISKETGRASYRGLIKINKNAQRATSRVQCDALLLGPHARSDTYPTVEVQTDDAQVGHEASVSHITDTQLVYCASRGLTAQQASAMIVNGFIDVFVAELPMEYALEINRLIALEMEGSIG
jgi:Fe-S cluster assembly protein SufB